MIKSCFNYSTIVGFLQQTHGKGDYFKTHSYTMVEPWFNHGILGPEEYYNVYYHKNVCHTVCWG